MSHGRTGYDTADATARFREAFPWFDFDRWAWSVDVNIRPPSDTCSVPVGDLSTPRDDIKIDMPGASNEQVGAVVAWLMAEYGPAATS